MIILEMLKLKIGSDTNRDSYNYQQTKREEQAVLPF